MHTNAWQPLSAAKSGAWARIFSVIQRKRDKEKSNMKLNITCVSHGLVSQLEHHRDPRDIHKLGLPGFRSFNTDSRS